MLLVEYNVNISTHENICTIKQMKNIHYLFYKTSQIISKKYTPKIYIIIYLQKLCEQIDFKNLLTKYIYTKIYIKYISQKDISKKI